MASVSVLRKEPGKKSSVFDNHRCHDVSNVKNKHCENRNKKFDFVRMALLKLKARRQHTVFLTLDSPWRSSTGTGCLMTNLYIWINMEFLFWRDPGERPKIQYKLK